MHKVRINCHCRWISLQRWKFFSLVYKVSKHQTLCKHFNIEFLASKTILKSTSLLVIGYSNVQRQPTTTLFIGVTLEIVLDTHSLLFHSLILLLVFYSLTHSLTMVLLSPCLFYLHVDFMTIIAFCGTNCQYLWASNLSYSLPYVKKFNPSRLIVC